MVTTHSYCDICLSACGLEVDVEDGRIVEVRGDKQHPLSQGYLCIRGKAGPASRQGKERLRHPLKRTGNGFERISWDRAYGEIASQLERIRHEGGPQAIGMYYGAGNPTSFFNFLAAQGFLSGLGSRKFFNVLSVEFTGRHLVFDRMYGHPFFTTAGDFERSSFVLLLGSNPAVSEEDPGKLAMIGRMRRRGGMFVVVDPRRTQTARKADRWLPIIPGTDVYLLLALLNVIFREKLYNREYVTSRCQDFDALVKLAEPWTPDRAAELTGLSSDEISDLARRFAAAPGACAVAKLGVYQTSLGTVAFWLIEALNAVTGNLERRGGVLFKRGPLPLWLLHDVAFRGRKARTRDGLYPEIIGSLPAASIPDEILIPGPDQLRALIVDCGNPLLSLPNEKRLRQAFGELPLLVSLDIFLNETARLAHYVLPAAAHFEKDDCYVTFPEHQPRRFIQWARPLVPPPGEAKPEWEVFLALSQRLGMPLLNTPGLGIADKCCRQVSRLMGAEQRWKLSQRAYARMLFPLLARLSLKRLLASPHGELLDQGSRPGKHPKGWPIRLVPAQFAAVVGRLEVKRGAGSPAFPLLLITGERERSKVNTRLWHIPLLRRLGAESFLRINPQDALRAGIATGDEVEISTPGGSGVAKARLSGDIRAGVISLPHGWGRILPGKEYEGGEVGLNPNRLTDDRARDHLTGMPVFNAIPCRIRKL